MVQFSDTGSEPQLTTAARPTAPVVDRSKEIGIKSMEGITSSLGDTVSGLLDTFAENKKAGVLNDFLQTQLKLGDAVDQGVMTSKDARMRARANFSTFSADNPRLVGEGLKLHKEFITTSGLGKVVAEGTEEEQRAASEMDDAVKKGFPATPEGLVKYQEQTVHLNELNVIAKETARLQADVTLDTSTRNLNQQVLAERGKNVLTNLADTQGVVLRNKFATLDRSLAAGDISAEDAVVSVNMALAEIQDLSVKASGGQNAQFVKDLIAPLENMSKLYTDKFTGAISATALENGVKNELNKTKLMILADPKTREFIAATQLIPNSTHAAAKADAAVLDTLSRLSKGRPPPLVAADPDEQEDVKVSLDVVQENMKAYNSGGEVYGDRKSLGKEIDTVASSIINSINIHKSQVESPDEYNNVVNFLASAEANKYFVESGGIPADMAAAASVTMQEEYANKVMPLITKEFTNANIRVGGLVLPNVAGVPNIITPQFRGNGVVFVMNEDALSEVPEGGREFTDIPATVKELNQNVAPILNRIVRMDATLSGTSNFKQVYTDRYAKLFEPEVAETEPAVREVNEPVSSTDPVKLKSRLSIATPTELKTLASKANDSVIREMAQEELDSRS